MRSIISNVSSLEVEFPNKDTRLLFTDWLWKSKLSFSFFCDENKCTVLAADYKMNEIMEKLSSAFGIDTVEPNK